MKLHEIINRVKGSCKAADIKPTDDAILNASATIYCLMDHEDKPEEIEAPKTLPKQQEQKPFNKPTKKQIYFLDTNGIEYNKQTLTFDQAVKLIKAVKDGT